METAMGMGRTRCGGAGNGEEVCIHVLIALALLLFTPIISNEASANANSTGGCIPSERSALISFKSGLLDPGNLLSSWEGDDCCQWNGVWCNNETGHIVELNLPGGSCNILPPWVPLEPGLGGSIGPSLLGLKQLEHLDLSCNNFSGTLPEFLGSLHNLRSLDLSWSTFVGTVPPQLGNLSNLRYFRSWF
uniref:Leucine-rich repeat-containing N-terminal plant-type domain-containing protein n=1 Tax=Oryza rufipogon TaxID=4529 RepID=A0A0E0MYX1_ORYRU